MGYNRPRPNKRKAAPVGEAAPLIASHGVNMPGFDAYLTSLEARISALEEIALEAESLRDLRKGDRVKFLSPTRWSCRPVWRVVNGLDPHRPGRVTVRFGGWGAFVVMPHEILEIERGPVDLEQAQQLAASPYLPEEIEGKNP